MAPEKTVRIDHHLGIGRQWTAAYQHPPVVARLNDRAQLVLRGQQYRSTDGGVALDTAPETVDLLTLFIAAFTDETTQRIQAHLA